MGNNEETGTISIKEFCLKQGQFILKFSTRRQIPLTRVLARVARSMVSANQR